MANTGIDDLVNNINKQVDDYMRRCYPNKPNDANMRVRFLSEILLRMFGSHREFAPQWIQLANYFFSILTGIISLFLFVQRYSMTEEDLADEHAKIRAFRGIATSFALLGVLTPIVITVFQMIFFDRLLFIKIVPPVLVGQTVSIIMWFLTWSRPVLKWFNEGLSMYHIVPLFTIVVVWTIILASQEQGLDAIIACIIIGVGIVLMTLSAIRTFRWRKLFKIGLFMACSAIIVFLIYIRQFVLQDDKVRAQCRNKWSEWYDHLQKSISLPAPLIML